MYKIHEGDSGTAKNNRPTNDLGESQTPIGKNPEKDSCNLTNESKLIRKNDIIGQQQSEGSRGRSEMADECH